MSASNLEHSFCDVVANDGEELTEVIRQHEELGWSLLTIAVATPSPRAIWHRFYFKRFIQIEKSDE